MRMYFGKHHGMTLEELAESKPSYAAWLLKQEWFPKRFPDLHDGLCTAIAELWKARRASPPQADLEPTTRLHTCTLPGHQQRHCHLCTGMAKEDLYGIA